MKRNWFSVFISIFMAIIFISVNIFSQIVAVGFRVDVFSSADFWFLTVSSTFTHIMAWYIASRNTVESEKVSNTKYVKKAEAVEFIVLNKLEEDFDEFLIEINRERRKQAWINKVNRKLFMLDWFATAKDLLVYRNLVNAFIKDSKGLTRHEYMRKHTWRLYPKLKERYLYLKSQEYIVNNADNLRVFFFQPYTRIHLTNVNPDIVRIDDKFEYRTLFDLNKGFGKVIYGLTVSVFMNTLLVSFVEFDTGVLLSIITSLATLGMNTYFGITHGKAVVENVYIYNLTLAQQVFDKYLAMKAKVLPLTIDNSLTNSVK